MSNRHSVHGPATLSACVGGGWVARIVRVRRRAGAAAVARESGCVGRSLHQECSCYEKQDRKTNSTS